MLGLVFRSLICHFKWWFASLWPGKHAGAPLSLQRLIFLLLGYPLFLALQFIHWFGFLIDELFFSGYRQIEIRLPVFIVGIPRSGTTFLHRALSTDQRYTSLTTWEAILAPSITERRILGALASIDRVVGRPFKRIINACLSKGAGDFNDIHEVGLEAPEEDYLALLPIGHCFILYLAFPFAQELYNLSRLNTLPEDEQNQAICFYKRCLQKHLYCHPNRQLLSKNAAFSSWTPKLQETFPDAKFIVCIRQPDTALSSQLSSIGSARSVFGTGSDSRGTTSSFTQIYAQSYETLRKFVESSTTSRVAVIEQSDLKSDSSGTIAEALTQLNIENTLKIDHKNASQPSKHHHRASDFPIDSTKIEHCMQPDYEVMLNSPNRSIPPSN